MRLGWPAGILRLQVGNMNKHKSKPSWQILPPRHPPAACGHKSQRLTVSGRTTISPWICFCLGFGRKRTLTWRCAAGPVQPHAHPPLPRSRYDGQTALPGHGKAHPGIWIEKIFCLLTSKNIEDVTYMTPREALTLKSEGSAPETSTPPLPHPSGEQTDQMIFQLTRQNKCWWDKNTK